MLADAGGLIPASIGEMLEDPVGALDEYEAAFERIRQSILALDGQGRTPEESRRIKELVARVEALPSVWEGSF